MLSRNSTKRERNSDSQLYDESEINSCENTYAPVYDFKSHIIGLISGAALAAVGSYSLCAANLSVEFMNTGNLPVVVVTETVRTNEPKRGNWYSSCSGFKIVSGIITAPSDNFKPVTSRVSPDFK